MKTKKDLSVVKVTSAKQLTEISWFENCYAAERIVRTYSEDFVNEDNVQITTVERNEIIFEKGHFLTADDFSVLLFHFQAGDLKEAKISNQQREGSVVDNRQFGIWVVKAQGAKVKLNMLLRASNAITAYEVAQDYIELNYKGYFVIENIKTFDDCIIIEPVEAKEEDDSSREVEKCWYNISIIIDEGEGESVLSWHHNYIVFADTVETAKAIIEGSISEEYAKKEIMTPFVVKIQEAKTINCNVIVPAEFCHAYFIEQQNQ